MVGLTEAGSVSVIAVVHVDDIFAVGRKEIYDRLCEDFGKLVCINNLATYHGTLVVTIPETWLRDY